MVNRHFSNPKSLSKMAAEIVIYKKTEQYKSYPEVVVLSCRIMVILSFYISCTVLIEGSVLPRVDASGDLRVVAK